jgi:hypothetical protein
MSKSYVLHSGGLDIFRNMREGIDADDITIKYPVAPGYVTPRKAMLMRGETNMMLLSPQQGALQVGWFLLWSVCHDICSIISSWGSVGARCIAGLCKGALHQPMLVS